MNSYRAICYIDGANVFSIAKNSNIHIDWAKFRDFMQEVYGVEEFRYYTAILPEMETGQEEHSIMKLYDWLRYNGFKLITRKAYKRNFQKADGTEGEYLKGNVDVELSVDAISLAPHYTYTYLFSGDGDFSYLLEKLSSIGHQVGVIGNQQYCAQILRQNINTFINMDEFSREKGTIHNG